MKVEDAVSSDKDVLSGTLCFKGTSIPVFALLEHLESGLMDDFYADYPEVTQEMISAVLRGAQDIFAERYGAPR